MRHFSIVGAPHGQPTRAFALVDEFCLIGTGELELEVDGRIVKRARRVSETMTDLETQGLTISAKVEQWSG